MTQTALDDIPILIHGDSVLPTHIVNELGTFVEGRDFIRIKGHVPKQFLRDTDRRGMFQRKPRKMARRQK